MLGKTLESHNHMCRLCRTLLVQQVSPSAEGIPYYQCFLRELFYEAKVAIIHRKMQQN
jgi:hypothetical protein